MVPQQIANATAREPSKGHAGIEKRVTETRMETEDKREMEEKEKIRGSHAEEKGGQVRQKKNGQKTEQNR